MEMCDIKCLDGKQNKCKKSAATVHKGSWEGSQALVLEFIFRNSFLLFLHVLVCPAIIIHPPFSPITCCIMFSSYSKKQLIPV